MSTVYLLHFWKPIAPGKHTCQHYCGSTDNLDRRIEEHRAGRGARFTEVAKERGIEFSVARVWDSAGETLSAELKRARRGRDFARSAPGCPAT